MDEGKPLRAGVGRLGWPPRGVDVWYAHAARLPAAARERILALCGPEERDRHARFVHAASGDAFLLSRAVLRTALSHYFPVAAAEWRFAAEPGGKPRVAAPHSPAPDAEFSLSHTAGLAACCFSAASPVGVDVEHILRATEIEEILSRRFTAAEQQTAARWSSALRAERIVWMWTAKEALLKAMGTGFRVAPERIPLACDHAGGISLEDRGGEQWQFTRLRLGGEYLAAVAHVGGIGVRRILRVDAETLSARRIEPRRSPQGVVEAGD